MAQHVSRRTALDDPPAVEHHDPAAEQDGIEQIVGHDDGRPVREHVSQHATQHRRRGDVESRERLVQQQQSRVRGDGPGHGHPLGLATGELRGSAFGELVGPDVAQPPMSRLTSSRS